MATVKSYTDLQQSKKLAEILPADSSDMCFRYPYHSFFPLYRSTILPIVRDEVPKDPRNIPCWSLAALLDIINENFYTKLYHDGVAWNITVWHHDNRELKSNTYADKPVDTCYEMILKLHRQNLL